MGLRRFLGWSVAAALAIAGLTPSALSAAPSLRSVITYAEQPGASPNFIFPYASCQYDSLANTSQFQMLMFRPLYWFGLRGATAMVPSLSLATAPRFSHGNRTVTITMKGWRFADGQVVNARSVMFFLNMYRADPSASCAYNPKFGIPDQVRSATGRASTVTITFSSPVNPTWILDNYLSQITPLPDVWDRTSPTHRAGCATGAFGTAATKSACTAVVAYLTSQGADPTTFTTPFWQSGDDGPWRLSAFDVAGNATFEANTHYSGPQRAQVHKFQEVAYTSALAEQNDLKASRLSLGYLDPAVLSPPAPGSGRPGPNWAPLGVTYSMKVGSPWAFNYAALNFSSADPESAAINQLYVRQALQLSVDQPTLIQSAFNGYASTIASPLPPGTPASIARHVTNPYPYDPSAAAALLASHGWTLVNGVLSCSAPGTGPTQCGSGISAGYTLAFNVVVAANSPALNTMVSAEAAIWRDLGIGVTVMSAPFDTVVGDCQGGSGFEICEWGTGWSYEPGYYPSGDALFSPGGPFNVGSYDDPRMTALISASIKGPGTLSSYAQYAAHQLPVLYQPQAEVVLEIAKRLKSSVGFAPNPLGSLTPEYFHF